MIVLNSKSVELGKRADDLLSKMSLQEKVSQLGHDSKAIEHAGIAKYNWWNECLHGVARAGIATVFPQAIGMAAMWNVDLFRHVAEVISDEARAKHHEFLRQDKHEIYQGLTYWTPNINIFRDPRWGRGMETYGEDPHLTARLGVEFVKGLQGDDKTYLKIVATPKHFAVHSGPEFNRHSFDAVSSVRDIWETYLPAFEACVVEAGAYSVMGAYNRLNGEACTASNFLIQNVLRDKWGFEGYVVSDAGAITDISDGHNITQSLPEAAALALKTGTDLCAGAEYLHLAEAVEKGFITEKEIDISLKRLLIAKLKLGMFDEQSKVPYASIPYSIVDCDKHKDLALKVAQESIVLLKNENNFLPLSKSLSTVAVIGPNADNTEILLGNYHGIPSAPVSLFEGIKNKANGKMNVIHERGCQLAEGLPFFDVVPFDKLFSDSTLKNNGILLQYFDNKEFKGEAVCIETINELNQRIFQNIKVKKLDESNFGIRLTTWIYAEKTGRYGIGVIGSTSFRLLVNEELLTEFHTIWEPEKVYESYDFEAGKSYKITLELDETTSEGHTQKLLWAVPDSSMEQRALDVAQKADVVVLAMGLSPQLEGEEMPVKVDGFRQGDRLTLDLPKTQRDFIQKIVATGKPMVLVLFNGCALSVNWEKENIPAIIESWYGGQSGGDAIADVLFGDYNPSGRLPVTFYKSVNDLPDFEDYSMKNRTYRYFGGETLFDFGFGLSYTTFKYSNLQLNEIEKKEQKLLVEVVVENTGNLAGDEVVQLYVSRVKAQEDDPIRSLQGFKKINLQVGEKKLVQFELSSKSFSRINENSEWVFEPDTFQISVGGSQPTKKGVQTKSVLVKEITL